MQEQIFPIIRPQSPKARNYFISKLMSAIDENNWHFPDARDRFTELVENYPNFTSPQNFESSAIFEKEKKDYTDYLGCVLRLSSHEKNLIIELLNKAFQKTFMTSETEEAAFDVICSVHKTCIKNGRMREWELHGIFREGYDAIYGKNFVMTPTGLKYKDSFVRDLVDICANYNCHRHEIRDEIVNLLQHF